MNKYIVHIVIAKKDDKLKVSIITMASCISEAVKKSVSGFSGVFSFWVVRI